jgi:hypothetical protein
LREWIGDSFERNDAGRQRRLHLNLDGTQTQTGYLAGNFWSETKETGPRTRKWKEKGAKDVVWMIASLQVQGADGWASWSEVIHGSRPTSPGRRDLGISPYCDMWDDVQFLPRPVI